MVRNVGTRQVQDWLKSPSVRRELGSARVQTLSEYISSEDVRSSPVQGNTGEEEYYITTEMEFSTYNPETGMYDPGPLPLGSKRHAVYDSQGMPIQGFIRVPGRKPSKRRKAKLTKGSPRPSSGGFSVAGLSLVSSKKLKAR